jgi:RNA polymerase sigma-70 factor (ECF subfamily)
MAPEFLLWLVVVLGSVAVAAGLSRADIERLYKSHGHLVWRRARRILGNDEDATDAVQQIFIGLLQRPEAFAGRSSATTFLYAVTTHHCLTTLRNRNNRQRILHDQLKPTAVFSVPGTTLDTVALRHVLDTIDDDTATAAVHHHCDEMSQDAIAAQMGVSRRQVQKLLAQFAAAAARVAVSGEGEPVCAQEAP